jgi:hypothetical protein
MKITYRGGGRMSGCLLQEAFPDTAKESGQIAKKEERYKAKKCGGPALAFLKAGDESLDPDRQSHRPLPPVEKLQRREGFQANQVKQGFVAQDQENLEFAPAKVSDCDRQEREEVKNLIGQQVDDVIGEKSRMSMPRDAESPAQTPNFKKTMYGNPVPSYFGKSLSDDGFADYSSSMTDNPGYLVQGSAFSPNSSATGLDKAGGSASLPIPSIVDAWKPITPSGARTSYFEALPQGQEQDSNGHYASFSKDEKQSLLQKLDTLFARLEELETKSNEYAHAEVSLFILSGLFLMFGLETVRKFR